MDREASKPLLLQLEELAAEIRRLLQFLTSREPKENNGEAEQCRMLQRSRGNPECGLWVPVSPLAGRSLWYVLITA